MVPDDNSVSGDNDANSDDHPTATVFVDKAVTATSSEATVVLREGGKPVIHTTHTTTKTINETLVEDLNILTQMTQDTSDDGGREEDEKRNQIQSDHSTRATANKNVFLTPHAHVRNKDSYQSKLFPVVTHLRK